MEAYEKRLEKTFRVGAFGRQLSLPALNATSAFTTFLFAMLYGIVEHTLLTSSLGVSILAYPLSLKLVYNIYFYHVIMFLLALLISFNPFLDVLLFRSSRVIKKQALCWGTGNILNFIWLEDLFYWVLFLEWPKDVMTPLNLSFYGIVWWYPVSLAAAGVLYGMTLRSIRRMKDERVQPGM
jgi:hypothetical protein